MNRFITNIGKMVPKEQCLGYFEVNNMLLLLGPGAQWK